MKKLFPLLLLLSTLLMAENAKLVDIVSENILKVEQNGQVKRIHLVGIGLFSTLNNNASQKPHHGVDVNQREMLKEKSLKYMASMLTPGASITYRIISVDAFGVEKVWLDNHELNYKMIRDGYAIVNLDDDYLPSAFKSRMTIAMKYAKENKIGLWGQNTNAMLALVDTGKHMCGWTCENTRPGLTRLAILKEQQNSLPKSVREPKKNIVVAVKEP